MATHRGRPSKTNAAPLQLVPQDQQVLDVTIECLRPSAAVTLEIQDEKKHVVGALNIADNTTVYELPLRVVYVLMGKPMNKHDPLGQTPPRPLYARPGVASQLQKDFENLDFITYLNTQALNQALITCVLQAPRPGPVPQVLAPAYQLLLDEDQLKQDGLLRNGVWQRPTQVTAHCEKLANATPGIGPFAGLTIFVHELDVPAPAPGAVTVASGTILPVEAKTLDVYRAGLSVGSKRTIAHELGHVLGLAHSFPDTDDADATKYGAAVTDMQARLAVEQKNLKNPTISPADIQLAQQTIQKLTSRLDWLSARLDVFRQNTFKFTKYSTENLMDYEQGNTRLSYWHWQWWLLQADVANYYGTKTVAR